MDAPRNSIETIAPRFPASQVSWEAASPREAGLEEALLEAAHETILSSYPKMYSFLVVRRGALIYERYYNGADQAAPMDLRSATKSVTAAVVAIAAEQGYFPGWPPVEDEQAAGGIFGGPTLGELFPDRLPRTASPALQDTSLTHLLTMTSGLHWQTGNRLGERWIQRLHRSKDWVRFALRLPVTEATRGAFQYRSVDSHLLSAAVSAAAGVTARELAADALFAPLGIAAPHWEADPQGITAGHIGLALTPRDLAKLGWLHAAGGVWEGRRVLPEAYVRRALTPHSEGLPAFGRYGWHWWIARTAAGDLARCALGHGGQLIFVVPERELVAVFTANPKVSRWKHPLRLLEEYILPATPP